MKAVLDHIGIAVKDLSAALAFYRDALGLEVEAPEEVASQRVRAHFVAVGGAKLELLEGTSADSAIAKYIEKRAPGLHHITLRVDDIAQALAPLRGRRVAFPARHGGGHRILPSELNFRANIYGFKVLGVERILSASAVGSLKHEYQPLDIVVPDQFFDRTRGRISTFFGRGL